MGFTLKNDVIVNTLECNKEINPCTQYEDNKYVLLRKNENKIYLQQSTKKKKC